MIRLGFHPRNISYMCTTFPNLKKTPDGSDPDILGEGTQPPSSQEASSLACRGPGAAEAGPPPTRCPQGTLGTAGPGTLHLKDPSPA